jgi:membrane-bound lytic murein transglycosylase B
MIDNRRITAGRAGSTAATLFGWTAFIALLSLLFIGSSHAEVREDYQSWLKQLRREASGKGISPATLQKTLDGLEPLPRVIELDRRQPEFTLTASDYLARTVTERRVQAGQEHLAENRNLLTAIGEKYAVPPAIIVALWGIESDYGRLTGGYSAVAALATLAYDGRRPVFFRKELLILLSLIDKGRISVDPLSGSWAGAMGQVQFMPSTFASYAVDWDGDGRADIWNSRADAFASAAHYLAKAGWRRGEGWGMPVRLPEGFDVTLAGMDSRRTLREWRALGLQQVVGDSLLTASLLLPEGSDGPAFLVLHNFRVLLRWNRSTSFALAVGHLAERLSAPLLSP